MAQCLSPFRKTTGEFFPCGKCYECKARKISGWSFRLLKEAERSSSAFFITLTYDNDHTPITENGYMTLSNTFYGQACSIEKYKYPRSKISIKKIDNYIYLAQNDSHLQKFFKKLRKNEQTKLKYYACGEYGGKTDRPHYHIILFNATLKNLLRPDYIKGINSGVLQLNGKDILFSPSWDNGHITIGKLSEASASYTLKYISKSSKIPIHRRDDRIPEFSLMSKRMGDNYLTPQMKRWHKNDILNRMYVPLKDGKKISIPRYLKDKIYTQVEKDRINLHIENQLLIKEQKKTEKEWKNDCDIRMAKGVKNKDNRNTVL